MTDFLIVGGGIVGLLLARELCSQGAAVTLIEQSETGREASWAGGGIVSPLYPWRYTEPVTQLANWAQDYYPKLVTQLFEETGIDAELEQSGLLMFDAEDQAQALQWARDCSRPMKLVDDGFIYDREPLLAKGFRQALWMPSICNVRNPRLLKAMKSSLLSSSSFQLIENTQFYDVKYEEVNNKKRVVSIIAKQLERKIELKAGKIIICAGSWSAILLNRLNLQSSIKPIRGQMLLIDTSNMASDKKNQIRSILLRDGKYLIPRRDGYILVGSTLEDVGFNKSTTHEALQQLKSVVMSHVLSIY